MLNIRCFICNFIEENCYVLWDETREAVVVDCGARADEELRALQDFIGCEQLQVRGHWLTHGHFDHLFGAQWLADTYGVAPRVSEADVATYYGATEQTELFLHRRIEIALPPLGVPFADGEMLSVGATTFQVLATPGHTPGGVCFYAPDSGVLLSGDSLFRGSIGRTDLPGGNHRALVEGLRQRVLTLPPETQVLPGHGPATTITDEQQNPYLL